MSLILNTCPKLIGILGVFYQTPSDPPPHELWLVEPFRVPQPYRRLLVHQRDMTSTLTNYHGTTIRLRVLDRRLADDVLARHIVLETDSGRPVEYGAARIQLASLDRPARDAVIEGRVPLGGILNAEDAYYKSCPGAFFKLDPTRLMRRVLELDSPVRLFGRCNCLSNRAGQPIAEVVEILPPCE